MDNVRTSIEDLKRSANELRREQKRLNRQLLATRLSSARLAIRVALGSVSLRFRAYAKRHSCKGLFRGLLPSILFFACLVITHMISNSIVLSFAAAITLSLFAVVRLQFVLYTSSWKQLMENIEQDKELRSKKQLLTSEMRKRLHAIKLTAETTRVSIVWLSADISTEDLVKEDWRGLRGIPFELYLKRVFENLGYDVEETPVSGDQGVDLIVKSSNLDMAVQVKGYAASVGNTPVQEVCTGMRHYGCTTCAAITNSTFTDGATELAKTNECLLIDASMIEDLARGKIEGIPRL